MSSDGDAPLLSEEEREALGAAVSSGHFADGPGHNVGLKADVHDLTNEDGALGMNVSSIDMINERFLRLYRLGMLEVLRTSPKINQRPAKIVRFGEYLVGKQPPLSVNMLRINPLRGYSMIVIEPSLIFSSLDNFFGGVGRGVGALSPGRMFTPTETRIINMMMDVTLRSLKEAWAPLMSVDFEQVGAEINPQFAQIADEGDLIVWSRFENETEDGGSWDLIYPYAAPKPLREVLRSRVQSGDADEASDAQWRMQLRESVQDSELEVRVLAGEAMVSLNQLRNFKVGDTLAFERYDEAKVLVSGIPSFTASLGEMSGKLAFRIERAVTPGD